MRYYFHTSNQIKVIYSSHCVLQLSVIFVSKNIFLLISCVSVSDVTYTKSHVFIMRTTHM